MKNTVYLVITLIVLSVISLCVGVVNIFDLSGGIEQSHMILITTRIPRLVALILSAMGLSICGVIFQQISRNRFVSPNTAGTINGAQLGLTVSLIFFKTETVIGNILFSLLFALLTSALFMAITSKFKSRKTSFIPLIGIMLGAFINSITVFLAYRFDIIQIVSSWFYGDFSKTIAGQYELLYLSIPLLIITILYVNKFTIVAMGKDFSVNLGVNYTLFINLGLIVIASITSIVVIIVGNVPFLGLVVPNIVSLMYGDNMRKNVKYVVLLGSIFLIACDIFGRLIIYPYELPIGVTAGIFGAIFFLLIIKRREL